MEESIEEKLQTNAIICGNIHLYDYENAMKLLELCKQNNIPILGIDSFIVSKGKTQPFLEHSIDLSENHNTYEDAKTFLKKKRDFGFVFEIIY